MLPFTVNPASTVEFCRYRNNVLPSVTNPLVGTVKEAPEYLATFEMRTLASSPVKFPV
jgi:hypothetical protein